MTVRLDENWQYLVASENTTIDLANYAMQSAAVRFGGGGAPHVTGVAATNAWRLMALIAGAGSIITDAEAVSSSAANRFITGITIGATRPAALYLYDGVSQRWRLVE